MAVRKPRNHGGNIIGMFPSLKMQRPVRYESTIERDLCYLLEFDEHVTSYHEQPFTIEHTAGDGKAHHYTPDFQVHRKNGPGDLVECKPAALQDDQHTRQQIAIGQAWADANDYTFCLVTDTELRTGHTLDKIKVLWRYCRMPVAHDLIARTVDYLTRAPGATVAQTAAAALRSTEQHQHVPYLYALLFRHILTTDLTVPLSGHSRLWLAAATPQGE